MGGGMAWRGNVESMGRFDVEFDVVLRAARRAGVRLIEVRKEAYTGALPLDAAKVPYPTPPNPMLQ